MPDIKLVLKLIAFVSLWLAICGSYYLGYTTGIDVANATYTLEKNALLTELIELRQKQDKVTVKVEKEYILKEKLIQGKTKTLIKEVPVYVTEASNSSCNIPVGFQLHWNEANSYDVSKPTSDINGATNTTPDYETLTTIKLRDVATQHSDEVMVCKSTENQLIALQNWIKEQQLLLNKD